jgi:hypothetical protein
VPSNTAVDEEIGPVVPPVLCVDSDAEPLPQDSGGEPPSQPSIDTWEMEEQLRHIRRMLSPEASADANPRPRLSVFDPCGIDEAHRAIPRWHYPSVRRFIQRRFAEKTPAGWLSSLISLVLSLGLMAFAFGGVLLTWSIFTGRQDLWTIGMPVALAGQIVLLMGFILQLDRLWSDHRHTAAKLEDVDERLDDLNVSASLLGSDSPVPPPSLFGQSHGGVSSQLLLADLKSQLDLLALKMGHEDRDG